MQSKHQMQGRRKEEQGVMRMRVGCGLADQPDVQSSFFIPSCVM